MLDSAPIPLLADDHALLAASIGHILCEIWPSITSTGTIDLTFRRLAEAPARQLGDVWPG
jgi:hypothetical protein